MDGTEVAKLTPGNDGNNWDLFGGSVSIDEKVVVGSTGGYIRVFSRDGTYERTIRCDDCYEFGERVATFGNLIVTKGRQNSISKLFIYSTEDGQLLKSFEQEDSISDVAMSEQFIVSTAGDGKTFIYNNTSPDFTEIAEINQSDKVLVGCGDDGDGEAYLYKTDGTLVTALDRQDASSQSGYICLDDWIEDKLYKTDGTLVTALDRQDASLYSSFGISVAITDDNHQWDESGYDTGSVFIYSAVTGEFIEKVVAPNDPDGVSDYDLFGSSVCASGSYYVVGAVDFIYSGAAYLFQFSEE